MKIESLNLKRDLLQTKAQTAPNRGSVKCTQLPKYLSTEMISMFRNFYINKRLL